MNLLHRMKCIYIYLTWKDSQEIFCCTKKVVAQYTICDLCVVVYLF